MSDEIVTIVGARPQLVKAAMVSAALERAGMHERLVHTGQHHDFGMSGVFVEELGIRSPDVNLGIHGGGHGAMTGRMIEGIEDLLVADPPACLVVYGDTNSTLAGALAAAKLHIPVAHVEAGLRSFNRAMPEELNRVVTDHLCDLLLAPTTAAFENLRNEGLVDRAVHVGDVMYDAFLWASARAEDRSNVLDRLGLDRGGYAVATVHRAENTDDAAQLEKVVVHLQAVAAEQPVVLPLHPRTKAALEQHGVATGPLIVVEPLGYLAMALLVRHAALVLTDSGGLQKEAYFASVPCVTLRTESEWQETIDHGWNRLWSTPTWLPRRPIADYGDGHASDHVVAHVAALLGR